MTRDRAIIAALLCVIAVFVVRGDTIEGVGLGLFVGLILGALLGVAFVYGERERSQG